jgi:hypothetical protein
MFRKRVGRFFYTGMADAMPLSEIRDLARRIGRLGIGVKTKIKTLEYYIKDLDFVREGLVLKPSKSHSDTCQEGGVRKELDIGLCGHFGIAIGIKVRLDN